jgi:hypothetical protein
MSRQMSHYSVNFNATSLVLGLGATLKEAQELVTTIKKLVPIEGKILIYRHYSDGSVSVFGLK